MVGCMLVEMIQELFCKNGLKFQKLIGYEEEQGKSGWCQILAWETDKAQQKHQWRQNAQGMGKYFHVWIRTVI